MGFFTHYGGHILTEKSKGSPERFGFSWERFKKNTDEQELQFQGWTNLLGPSDVWNGVKFMDVGCGAGRNSYWAMKYGAAEGLAIDVDDRSLNAAKEKLAEYPSMGVKYLSAYDIDEHDQYDIVFSIGVIHHLSDPELAVRRMTQATRPGGKVLIWVYGKENLGGYVLLLDPLRKYLFSRMPLPILHTIAWVPAVMLWGGLKIGLGRLGYLKLLRKFPLVHLHHIVFDQMLPQIANYWTREEAENMLKQANLEDVQSQSVNDISWTVTGVRS